MLGRPFIASFCAIAVSYAVYLGMLRMTAEQSISFLIAFVIAIAAYAVFALLFGAVKTEDVAEIPLLQKFIRIK